MIYLLKRGGWGWCQFGPYVDPPLGRARAEGAHGDLDGGQRSSEVK